MRGANTRPHTLEAKEDTKEKLGEICGEVIMDYKSTRSGLLNTEKAIFEGVGPYDIPQILPIEADVEGLESVGFNYMLGCKNPQDKILHFFLDDYQFERVWKEPNKYLPYLQKFRYVIAPDFSLYIDHPRAVQIFNHYRKHWCARYWQENGVNVIPCICWSDEASYEWCFDGTPVNSTVCVSTIGGFGNHGCNTQGWLNGFEEMNRRLRPRHVIMFGKTYKEVNDIIYAGCEVSIIRNEQLSRKDTLSAKSVRGTDAIPMVELEGIEYAEG